MSGSALWSSHVCCAIMPCAMPFALRHARCSFTCARDYKLAGHEVRLLVAELRASVFEVTSLCYTVYLPQTIMDHFACLPAV